MRTFAIVLMELREMRGLSMKELALKAGITPGAISHYESGRYQPRWYVVQRLAKALRVSTERLKG